MQPRKIHNRNVAMVAVTKEVGGRWGLLLRPPLWLQLSFRQAGGKVITLKTTGYPLVHNKAVALAKYSAGGTRKYGGKTQQPKRKHPFYYCFLLSVFFRGSPINRRHSSGHTELIGSRWLPAMSSMRP